MEKEEFDELLELHRKATVFKSNYAFERLERLFRWFLGAQSFTPDEIPKLISQFNSLSTDERERVIFNATHEPHPAYFHLNSDEADKLNIARRELSLHERAQLFKFFEVYGGYTCLDLGEVFSGKIEIDDHSSPPREKEPYAHIYFSDGYRRRVETVDILESVKQNPLAIGHPAIAAAVYYWQRAIYFKNVRNRKDKDDDLEGVKMFREWYSRKRVRVAEKNLQAVCAALEKGAHDRSLDEKAAVVINLEKLDLDNQNNILYRTWKGLKNWEADDDGLERFEEKLLNEGRENANGNLHFDTIMKFLRDEEPAGGYKFVGAIKKPSWKSFRNAFKAWYSMIDVRSVKNYPSQVKKKLPDYKDAAKENVVSRFSIINLFSSTLQTAMVYAREPVWLDEHDIGFNIEDAIEAKCHPEKL